MVPILVAVDAARRGRNWLAWALLVAFTGLVGAIAWLVMRRRAPIVEEPGAVRSVALRLIGVPLVFISVAVTTFVVTFWCRSRASRVEPWRRRSKTRTG